MLNSISSFFSPPKEEPSKIKSTDSVSHFNLKVTKNFVEGFNEGQISKKEKEINELIQVEVKKKIQAREKEMQAELKKIKEDSQNEIRKLKAEKKKVEFSEDYNTASLIRKTESLIAKVGERKINVKALECLQLIESCYKRNPGKTLFCRDLVQAQKIIISSLG